MNRLEKMLALTSLLLILLIMSIVILTLGGCTSYRPTSCPPNPAYPSKVKQKLPQPHTPFTKHPFKAK